MRWNPRTWTLSSISVLMMGCPAPVNEDDVDDTDDAVPCFEGPLVLTDAQNFQYSGAINVPAIQTASSSFRRQRVPGYPFRG